MNILYITHLTGRLSVGPCYSVPAQISAQAKYDNVFWWNLTSAILEQWTETGVFHNINEFPYGSISSLPKPFDEPDMVVFESFYYIAYLFHAFECKLRNIPYVIVPRSSFTKQGQAQKYLKKSIANFLLFGSMAQNASAIHFLTENELKDSGDKWNTNYFIEPNGIVPGIEKFNKKNDTIGLIGTYIGRFDIYQKGLDLLLDSVIKIQEELRKSNITINLYGPEFKGEKELLRNKIKSNNIADILIINEGVFGKEKEKVLIQSDFFIMTSRFEGMPMSMIEAMSYGLPCFASRGTNLSEEIKVYKAGWTCDNTVESIIKAFNQLVIDKKYVLEYGKNAFLLSQKYDWDAIAKRTHNHYEELVNN